jgi:hypothetical protein
VIMGDIGYPLYNSGSSVAQSEVGILCWQSDGAEVDSYLY